MSDSHSAPEEATVETVGFDDQIALVLAGQDSEEKAVKSKFFLHAVRITKREERF